MHSALASPVTPVDDRRGGVRRPVAPVEIVDFDAISGEDDGAATSAYVRIVEPNGADVWGVSGRDSTQFRAPRTGTHKLVVYLGESQTGTIQVKLTGPPEPTP